MTDPPIETIFVRANGLTFEVDCCGAGPCLALCLHGFPECSFSWRHQLPLLARLGYTAWAPNLRGYGRSSRPLRVADYGMPHLLADVAGLMDAAARPTLLIGHDWGGAIAWTFLLENIRPVECFVVLNMPHPTLFFQHLFGLRQLLRSWYIFFFQVPCLPEWAFKARAAKAIGDAFRNMAVDKTRFPNEVLDVYRRQVLMPGALTAMLNYYRAMFRGVLTSKSPVNARRPRMLDVPTLMIWGEQDTALGKELTYGTDELVRDLTVRYLPNVSHWVQQEAPEAVNAFIEGWLATERISSPRGDLGKGATR